MEIDQNIFYDEFSNKLKSLEDTLLELKDGNYEKENIDEVFRSIHTIKGTADLLGMFDVVSVTHKSEDLLDEIRSDRLRINPALCTLFMELKDYIALSVSNTSNGIYDDPICENLTIYFDKQFNNYLSLALDEAIVTEDKTILVVEDTTLNRYTIKKVAQDNGYSVLMCNNGTDGYNRIKENDIDLVFCDLSTPNADGDKLVRLIKNDILYDHIPIVILVDRITIQVQKLAKDIGVKAWLTKPIQHNLLQVVLDKILTK